MNKVSMTFRIDAELAKRLKDSAAKSAGRLTQVDIIESALADRFAVKDGTKLLAKVNENQQTAVTLVQEQTEAIAEFKKEVARVVSGYKTQVQTDVARLEQTTTQEMRNTSASVRTLESQMASMIGTLRQIEASVEKTAESRLSLLHWLGLVGLVALSFLGVAALGVSLWQRIIW